MQRVVDITTFYSVGRGGVTTYLEQKSRLLAAQKEWQHFLILGGDRDTVGDFHGSRCHWVRSAVVRWNPNYRYLLNFFKIRRALQSIDPHVVETADPYWIPFYLAIVRAQAKRKAPQSALANAQLLLFYRSDLPDTYLGPLADRYLPWLRRPLVALGWWWIRRVTARMDRVLVHSEVMADKLRRHRITTPLRVVGNLTSVEAFATAQRDNRDGRNGRDGQLQKRVRDTFADADQLLLYCGRLAWEKGLELLLPAWPLVRAKFPRAVQLLIGSGPMQAKVKALAADRSERLLVLPATTDSRELATHFANVDLLVVPGPYETFSMVALEGIATGLPVAAVRGTGGISALVQPGVGFLSEKSNAEGLAQAMLSGLQPKGRWYQESVRRSLLATYQPQAVLKQLLAAYHK